MLPRTTVAFEDFSPLSEVPLDIEARKVELRCKHPIKRMATTLKNIRLLRRLLLFQLLHSPLPLILPEVLLLPTQHLLLLHNLDLECNLPSSDIVSDQYLQLPVSGVLSRSRGRVFKHGIELPVPEPFPDVAYEVNLLRSSVPSLEQSSYRQASI